MKIRENIEWTNIWSVNADTDDKYRILLVGDSICNGYYQVTADNIKDKANVDKLATSRAIDTAFFKNQLKNMLDDFEYNLIHFNNGLHGFHLSAVDYEKSYREIIEIMLVKSKVILATSTPVMQSGTFDVIDEKAYGIVKSRNEVVFKLADEYKLAVNDLYNAVKDNYKIRAADGYHYTEEGYKILGDFVAQNIIL